MDTGKLVALAASATIIIVVAAAALTLNQSQPAPVGETTTLPGNHENATATTSSETTTKTSTTASESGVRGMFRFNLSGKLPYVEEIYVNATGGGAEILVYMELPTPCHNASLSYNDGRLVVDVTSPPPKTMCVQVVASKTLKITVDSPLPSRITIEVIRDGRPAGKIALDLEG